MADDIHNEEWREHGVTIRSKVFPPGFMKAALHEWLEYAGKNPRTLNKWNPVDWPVIEPKLPDIIKEMSAPLLELASSRHMTGWRSPMLYNRRFVVKDIGAPATPLHQDSGYHVGNLKVSAFVAFTHTNENNGGMMLYRGTHKYGYLGDVGEINRSLLTKPATPQEHAFGGRDERAMPYSFAMNLNPGDVVFMNSNIWHESGPNLTAMPRIMMDLIIEDSKDAVWWPRDKTFTRSRTSRLIELQAENDHLNKIIDGMQS